MDLGVTGEQSPVLTCNSNGILDFPPERSVKVGKNIGVVNWLSRDKSDPQLYLSERCS